MGLDRKSNPKRFERFKRRGGRKSNKRNETRKRERKGTTTTPRRRQRIKRRRRSLKSSSVCFKWWARRVKPHEEVFIIVYIRAECLSTTLSLVHFSSKRLPLSSPFLLHFYISNHSLCLGFLPHKINTHKHTHTLKRERKTDARKTTTTDDRFWWFFYPLFGCSSSSSSSSITNLKNNIFESLFSSSSGK